ncbi:cytochrome protein [Biscogniauxia sp. FL1348]|nr:cytochrome protein [Biscogniauxia sp. FL1348]
MDTVYEYVHKPWAHKSGALGHGTVLVATILGSAAVLYSLYLAVYRLYFSPLSVFPGPRLAALTHWYEAYYDLVSKGEGGQFTFEIKRMHQKYGPIVRINPDELHIDDPEFYSEIYCQSSASRPIDKSTKFKYRFGIPNATFSTTTAEHHRVRRAAIAPFFSKARVRNLNDNLLEITERISHRLSSEYAGTGRVINVSDMWGAMTADVITELAFGRSADCTSAPDFKSSFSTAMGNLAWSGHWNSHFRFLVEMMNWVPDHILSILVPPFAPIMKYRAETSLQISSILSGKNIQARDGSTPTIFHDILASNLPAEELSLQRLSEESISVNGAGQETVMWTLTVACFYILDQPKTQACLKTELINAMPDSSKILPWEQLEKLPYLSAVIAESLRLGYGQVQRLPRINRLGAWKYGDWIIPPGVIVGMDAYHMHTNEDIFPEPLEFKPERWLQDQKDADRVSRLSQYLVPFSRGSRACVGIHLAYMELMTALATIFRRHEFELFDTDRTDVEFTLDMIRPMPKRNSKGVRVIVKS